MSVKEIKESIEKEQAVFGLKESMKKVKKSKSKKSRVFVISDARPETVKKLQENKVDFEKIKSKVDVAKELGLDFECEVFCIN